jgi:mxaK protein
MGLTNIARPTRRRTRLVLLLMALALVAALVDAALLWRAARVNAQIDALVIAPSAAASAVVGAVAGAGTDVAGPPPELRFAQAWAQSANGAHDAALNRYRALQADPRLGAAARFNSANLLVRQAAVVQASAQPGQAIPLLALAKEYYRDVLRDDPTQWDARYNLERAQRLLPDPDESEEGPVTQERNRERAVTTMRGYSPGLP